MSRQFSKKIERLFRSFDLDEFDYEGEPLNSWHEPAEPPSLAGIAGMIAISVAVSSAIIYLAWGNLAP